MPSVRPKPILSILMGKRRTSLSASTTCNIFQSVQCESPFLATKQVKLLSTDQDEVAKTTFGRLRRSYSIRTFGKSSSSLSVDMIKSNHSNLKSLLNDSDGVSAFRQFLAGEFSEENLDFWFECEKYKREKRNKQCKKAKKIFETFVKDNAPREVNIDSRTKFETLNNIKNPNSKTFESAQDLIFTLMERDSFPRFLTVKTSQTKQSKKLLASASSSLLLEENESSKPAKLKRQSSM